MKSLVLYVILLFPFAELNGQVSATVEASLDHLYDDLIEYHPDLTSQKLQYQCAQANKLSASGAFDYQVASNLSHNYNSNRLYIIDPRVDIIGSELNTQNTSLSTGVNRLFRSGLSASTSLEYFRSGDNYPFNAFNENVGSFVSNNVTSLNLSLVYPLLRNKGRDIVASAEHLADIDMATQAYVLESTTSQLVFTMSLAYWDYVMTYKSLEAFKTNEQRIEQLLQMTTDLVQAERKPQSDLIQLEADLRDKQRQTINAEQQYLAARNNLGRAVGYDALNSDLIKSPKDEFPIVIDEVHIPNLEELIAMAHKYRPDLFILEQAIASSRINKRLTDNDTKPILDLTANAQYSGTQVGNDLSNVLSALGQSEGRNYQTSLSLRYVIPINNNRAKGAQMKAALQLQDRHIQLENTIRNIELNISTAYANFLNTTNVLDKASSALTYYKEAYENEQIKFRSGLTTILNVIIFQERLTFAELDYLRSQHQYASAIAELRYRTGSNWIRPEDSLLRPHDIFYSLPQAH